MGVGDWSAVLKAFVSVPDETVMKACSREISGPQSGVELPREASGRRFASTLNEG